MSPWLGNDAVGMFLLPAADVESLSARKQCHVARKL
jgi:hypothetical protein